MREFFGLIFYQYPKLLLEDSIIDPRLGSHIQNSYENFEMALDELADIQKVKNKSGKEVCILNLRNPLGSFEWKGDWSDTSPQWTDKIKT